MRAALILAPGFEEGEALTIADVLRRGGFACDLVSDEETVTGAHQITVKSDQKLTQEVAGYDMIILPGGYGGAASMREDPFLIGLLEQMDRQGKFICAMCAAPIVLEKAGLLKNRKYTAYIGYDKKIQDGQFLEDQVVVDGHLVTGRGPATVYAFAYKLVDLLGGDSLAIKKRMLYFNSFSVKEEG